MIGLDIGSLISLRYLEIYRACVALPKKPMYSATTIDNVTISCPFLSHDTGPPATIKIFPFVEWYVSLYPVKLELMYLVGLSSPSALYVIP